MSLESQAPLKRGRTAANKSRGFENPSEELSHVANLVERRRVQNRISQGNYRNKIRNRLEKLEALVETNKAHQQSQPPGVPSSPNLDVSLGSTNIDPTTIRVKDRASQIEPLRVTPQGCICPFGDFDTACSCGGMGEIVEPLLDLISSFSHFIETDNVDSLYLSLPSPESLHCNTPLTPFKNKIIKFDNVSVYRSLSEQTSSSASRSSEGLDNSTLSLDMSSDPPFQQPYDHFHGQFPVPLGYHMVPMGYIAAPGKPSAAYSGDLLSRF
ncbi:hypothetical protein GQ44DRAFT_769368 [Phaeosphaeriaceae sp. PMI808]|nr:hypothetical protein GQ44DRAFT_769368 [Phaeosphaeriaceae sp. PMI808]